MFSVPVGDSLLPIFSGQFVLLHHPLGQEAIIGQESMKMDVLLKVSVLGLNSVTGQKYRCLGRTVDFIR